MQPIFLTVGIVGTGAMGRGIAQMAAQAGSSVLLWDAQPGASEAARRALADTWQKLVAKGKLTPQAMQTLLARVACADALASLAPCSLVIEAIAENKEIKQRLFAELEGVLAHDAVLATHTSSLSVTALGSALKRPGQLAGFHFFNPVPLMRVVEVIAGLKTESAVCQQLLAYARQFGHTPVTAQDTPGFVVNHAGRGYGTEAQRVVRVVRDSGGFATQRVVAAIVNIAADMCQQGICSPQDLELAVTLGLGYPMGPLAMGDRIGPANVLEILFNMQTVYGDPRYRPSPWLRRRGALGLSLLHEEV